MTERGEKYGKLWGGVAFLLFNYRLCLICAVIFVLRLEESSKRLQRDRKHKLHDWEERLNSIDTFLRKAERETDKFEPIGDDLETVRRQNEDFEVCASHDHPPNVIPPILKWHFAKLRHNGKGMGITKHSLLEPLYYMTTYFCWTDVTANFLFILPFLMMNSLPPYLLSAFHGQPFISSKASGRFREIHRWTTSWSCHRWKIQAKHG